jgi:hypothetical protein
MEQMKQPITVASFLYSGRSYSSSAVSIVDGARKMFHCACHNSNEFLNSSKSFIGGEPYGLKDFCDAFSGIAMQQGFSNSRFLRVFERVLV